MQTYTNLNGKLVEDISARVSIKNRAFRYGYGLFETMLYKDGAIRLAPYHWARLWAGMQQLQIEVPTLLTQQALEQEVHRTVAKNQMERLCRVRLQVDAGAGGLYYPHNYKAHYTIECFELEEDLLRLNGNGLILGIAEGINKSKDSLANLKTGNALVYAMAARQAQAHQWNDALVCNTDGNIIESTIANVFWVKDNVVYTPPLSEGCIAGVMRQYIIDKMREGSSPVIEMALTEAGLSQADEVFLTNAIRGVKWVKEVGDSIYNLAVSAKVIADLIN